MTEQRNNGSAYNRYLYVRALGDEIMIMNFIATCDTSTASTTATKLEQSQNVKLKRVPANPKSEA